MKSFVAILWLLTIGCWGYMLLMTHGSSDSIASMRPVTLSDSIDHMLAFGLLGGLLTLSIWALLPRHPLMIALPILLVYAAIDELTRSSVTPRAQFKHWLADTAGSIIAIACIYLFWLLSGVLRRKPPATPASGEAPRGPGLGLEVESALANFTDAQAEVGEQMIRVEKTSATSSPSSPVRARARRRHGGMENNN